MPFTQNFKKSKCAWEDDAKTRYKSPWRYTMSNINCNLENHELQLCEGHTHKGSLSPLIKGLKKALLSEVETGSLVGELTCGEKSIAA